MTRVQLMSYDDHMNSMMPEGLRNKVLDVEMGEKRYHAIWISHVEYGTHKVYCQCGCIFKFTLSIGFGDRVDCPNCDTLCVRDDMVNFSMQENTGAMVANDIRFYEDEIGEGSTINKIALKILIGKFYYNKQAEKLTSSDLSVKFVFNKDTHAVYMKWNRKLYRLSEKPNQTVGDLSLLHNRGEVYEAIHEFFKRVYEYLGISYTLPFEGNRKQHFGSSRIASYVSYIRFPVLRSIPSSKVPYDVELGHYLRKVKPTYAEFMHHLYGVSGKGIVRIMKDKPLKELLAKFARWFEDPNLILPIYEYFMEEISPTAREGFYTEMRGGLHDTTLDLILSLHQDKKHMHRRIFALIEELTVDRAEVVPNLAIGPNTRFVRPNITRLVNYLDDIARLMRSIIAVEPDYQFRYKGDLRRLHDDLSKELPRFQNKDKVITYKESMLEMEGVYGDYTFMLPKSTHEIIRLGSELSVCIGGYAQEAFDNHLTIMVARPNKEGLRPIALDFRGDIHRLSQVKTYHNNRPNHEEATSVIKFLKDNFILYADNHDLYYYFNPTVEYKDNSSTNYARRDLLEAIDPMDELMERDMEDGLIYIGDEAPY